MVCYVGLLWTHTRAAVLALMLGLVLLAVAQRRWLPVLAAAVVVATSAGFFAAYSSIGPTTTYTQSELAYLREHARVVGTTTGETFSANESSLASHWRNLRQGLRTVVHHPQGFGLGNAGTEAKRTGAQVKAGESTYTELGVETGLAGMLVFVAWGLAVLRGLWLRSAWLFSAFAAVLALALQTDVLGVPWLAYVVFALCGAALDPVDDDQPQPVGAAANERW